jgi:hypothetical protein
MHGSNNTVSASSSRWEDQARANCQSQGNDLKAAYRTLIKAYLRRRAYQSSKITK